MLACTNVFGSELLLVALMAFFCIHSNALASTTGSSPGVYTLTDLGTLGGNDSYAFSINNSGSITGYSQTMATDPLGGEADHAFLYTTGMIDLGTLTGDADSAGFAINASGNIAGIGAPEGGPVGTGGGGTHAIFFDPTAGTISDLGSLDNAGPNDSYGYGLNDAGAVVGYSFENYDVPQAPFLATPNGYMAPCGIDGEYALAINNANIVVGSEEVYFNNSDVPDVAAYSTGGTFTIFGPDSATGGTPRSYAVAINNASPAVIAGYLDYSNSGSGYGTDSQAFVFPYPNGPLTTLGLPIGSDTSRAYGLNNNNIAVGTAYSYYLNRYYLGLASPTYYSFGRATIFENGNVYYLDDLLTGTGASGWSLGSAMSINDSGSIVGWGVSPSGNYHAYLLTPASGTPATPPADTKLTAADDAGSGIGLSWTDNSGGKAYHVVDVDSGTGFTELAVTQPGQTSINDGNVTAGQSYTFEVFAANSVGDAAPSNQASATYTLPAATVTSITPVSVIAGKAATITIHGANFYGSASQAEIGGIPLTTTYESSTKLKAVVSVADTKVPGTYKITVANGALISNAVNFKSLGPILTVTVGTITRTTTISVPITITNNGNTAADSLEITASKLNLIAPTTTLPVVYGAVTIGAHPTQTLDFPITAGKSGKSVTLTISGTYTGGTFKSTQTVLLP